MKISVIIFTIGVALGSPCIAQSPTPSATPLPDKDSVEAADRAYEAAYAKGDVKAMSDFFTEDADYITEDGQTYHGKAEIEEGLRSGFVGNKGSTLKISSDSVRGLAPGVVVEQGSTTVTAKDGTVNSETYTSVELNKDGAWKISQLVESPLPDVSAHEQLSELSWLIGDWEEADKDSDIEVHSHNVWARGGNYITRNISVKTSGETTLEGWQIIGWDAAKDTIRSWTFDDEGGFSEGTWTRDGQSWLLRDSGVASDGSRTTADITFTKVNADKFTWESVNRTLDGEPQPSIGRIEISRVQGE